MNIETMIMNYIKNGLSPKNIAMKFLNKNPIVGNLINMAEKGDEQSVQNFARNVFKEKGRDFDKEFEDFRKKFE